MPKSESQKLKILYIAKYLLEKTDKNHAVGATDIKDYLMEEYGVESERRSTENRVIGWGEIIKIHRE